MSPQTIDSRIWPRMAVIAERLWSPASVTDVDDMYRRLDAAAKPKAEIELAVVVPLRRLVAATSAMVPASSASPSAPAR